MTRAAPCANAVALTAALLLTDGVSIHPPAFESFTAHDPRHAKDRRGARWRALPGRLARQAASGITPETQVLLRGPSMTGHRLPHRPREARVRRLAGPYAPCAALGYLEARRRGQCEELR